jgi:hypothetical protein
VHRGNSFQVSNCSSLKRLQSVTNKNQGHPLLSSTKTVVTHTHYLACTSNLMIWANKATTTLTEVVEQFVVCKQNWTGSVGSSRPWSCPLAGTLLRTSIMLQYSRRVPVSSEQTADQRCWKGGGKMNAGGRSQGRKGTCCGTVLNAAQFNDGELLGNAPQNFSSKKIRRCTGAHKFTSSPPRSERLWGPPSFLSNGYKGLFPGWPGREADH